MDVEERDGEVTFSVRVIPRSQRDEVEGEHGGVVKIGLKAPPVDDRANESLRHYLAGRLNVPKAAVKISAGHTSRTKRVRIIGATRAGVLESLFGESASSNS